MKLQFVYNKRTHRTTAIYNGRIVGIWEPAGLLLGCRVGTILRPRDQAKMDIVDMNSYPKAEWKKAVENFVQTL